MSAAQAVEDRLYRTIAKVLGVAPGELSEETSPETVASWDSLNHLNLVMALESEYGISLSPEDTLEMHNVGMIRTLLDQPLAESGPAITFVDCREEHVPALRAFFARMYRPDYVLAANEDYLRWQFGGFGSSRGNGFHIKLALVEGKITGCLGCFPVDVNLGGRLLRGCWLANWMVDQEQRQLGLGPLLVREVVGHFDVTLALGPNKDAHDILARMGWVDFGKLGRHVCVLDTAAAGALTETGRLDWPAQEPRQQPRRSGHAVVRRVDRFDNDVGQLWDSAWGARESAAGTRRSAEFLNWRYAEHPEFPYRLFETRLGGRLGGLAVYRVEEARGLPVRVGRITELVAQTEDSEAIMLAAVIEDARSQQAAALDFFCASQRLAGALAHQGFLPGEHPLAAQIPVLYQPLDRRRTGIAFMAYLGNVPEGAAALDWYVTKADGDQDRPN